MVLRWARTPEWLRRLSILIAVALAAALIMGPVMGCSTPAQPKGKCPAAKGAGLKTKDGTWYYIFDQDNADLIGLRMAGIAASLCDGSGAWATIEVSE